MMVYLVGAGPGDPGLITVRGQAILQIADVVVHDRLISMDLLRLAPAEATIINVGKSPDGQRTSQETINAILIEHGKAGKTVARLKGGDPFVFGRGGEELIALKAAGIPVEVVPGISSAMAAPAYAGVPSTHRNLSTSFTIVTAHEDPSKPTSMVDYEALANSQGLFFLMGVRHLDRIVSSLMQYGRPADTPVTCVEWGTFPRQRIISGTLDTIANIAAQQSLKSPAVIVVGEVAGLSEELAWQKTSPLADKRIALGSITQRCPDLPAHLTARGAFVTNLVHALDVAIIASPDETRYVMESQPELIVCCDVDAAEILHEKNVPFVEIQAATAQEFVAQLEALLR